MKIVLTICLFFLGATLFAHRFYVSIADLTYNASKNRIQGSIKLTAHDVEDVLSEKFERKIDLEQESDSSEVGIYFKSYLAANFKLYSGEIQANPHYLGKEINVRQDLYVHFFFSNITNPKAITIFNTLLFERFQEQQNIVHYKLNDQTKSITLIPLKPSASINFD